MISTSIGRWKANALFTKFNARYQWASVYVSHFFNHQTHHRVQVHCMLTQAGMKSHDTASQ
jgi:uncharacterized damage-inducible protein DinB